MAHSDGHSGHGGHHGGSHHDHGSFHARGTHDIDRGTLEHMSDVTIHSLGAAVAFLNSGRFNDSLAHPPYSRALREMTGPTKTGT